MAPKGDVAFSYAVMEAFRKRNRALSRRGASVECMPIKEIIDGRESDIGRMNVRIVYSVERAKVVLRVEVWDDRWVWVDARRSSKSGWVWEFTIKGRFVSPGGAREIVECAEETLSAANRPADEVPRRMSAIWSQRLAGELRSV